MSRSKILVYFLALVAVAGCSGKLETPVIPADLPRMSTPVLTDETKPSEQEIQSAPVGRLMFTAAPVNQENVYEQNIYTINADDSNLKQLTDTGRPYAAAWSPDGQQIAFNASQESSGAAMYLMNADRSQIRQIKQFEYAPGGLAWSPIAPLLAVDSGGPLLVTSEGKDVRVLGAGTGNRLLRWSPNGRYIVTSFVDSMYDMHSPTGFRVLNTETGEILMSKMPTDPSCDQHCRYSLPDWSPDSKMFVFNANGPLATMSLTDSAPTLLNQGHESGEDPRWSPNGKKIAFIRLDSSSYDIFTINPDGSELTQLTHDEYQKECVVWSPDSRHLAYTAYRDLRMEIFVINADGTAEKSLAPDNLNEGCPSWAPK